MAEQSPCEELRQRLTLLENALVQRNRVEEINSALLKTSEAISTTYDLSELYKKIQSALSPVIDTSNFFVALYDNNNGSITFPYVVDTRNGCRTHPGEVGGNASLTARVVRADAPVMMNRAEILNEWARTSLVAPPWVPAECWLGVPLRNRGGVIGVMAVQNYLNRQSYDQTDVELMVAAAAQLAMAIEGRNAEETLRKSDERFFKLLQDIPSISVQGYGSDGTTFHWNHASELLYGYSAREAIGRNLLELIIPPEMRADVKKAIGAMVETGQPIPASELSLLRKDGSRVTVLSSHAVIQVPGRAKQLFCLDIDLTENKRSEEALRIVASQLQSVFRAAPVGIGVVINRVFTQVNERLCKMTGYAESELLGQNALMLYTDKASYDHVGKEKYRQIQHRGTGTVETKWRQKNGSIIDILLSSTPFDTSDLSRGVTFTATDITEQKRAGQEREKLQSQLTQAQKMESVGRLAGGVAHDFNNILGVIMGHAEMTLDQMDPGQPFYDNLREILKAANRSSDLTRQLLAFARKQTIAPKVLELNKTVEELLKMLRRLIGENIDLVWVPSTESGLVKMDPSQIDQILANLCVNARDAISGVGKVVIATATVALDHEDCASHPGTIPGDYILLTVSDNGCGIEKEIMENIFEPFFTTKESGEGTGLGLATIYGIIKQNNGCIRVTSEPGQGTTFNIYLPRYHGNASQADTAVLVKPPSRNHGTILLLEDDPAFLKMTTSMLENLGYAVLAASSPGEALRLAEQYPTRIDLLMTDVIMPEMDGRTFAETMLFHFPGLKRLYMSGYTSDAIVHQEVLEQGFTFIRKPFSMKNLVEKLRETLEREA